MLTKADIFTAVLKRLPIARGQALELEDELRETLRDVAARTDALQTQTVLETVAATHTYALPDQFLRMIARPDLAGVGALERAMGKVLRHRIRSGETSGGATTGRPTEYGMLGGSLILYPVPDGVYEVTLHHSVYHDGDLDDVGGLGFEDGFREAIVLGVVYRLWDGALSQRPNAAQEADRKMIAYERALETLRSNEQRDPGTTRYRDV